MTPTSPAIGAPRSKHTGEALPGSAFWREAFTVRGTATGRVMARTLVFALVAVLTSYLLRWAPGLRVSATVMEVSGLVLGLLLVFRTAAGYDRWWEARGLWGSILNQSRNLAVMALAYGPADPGWRSEVVRWIAAFGHAARATLQDTRALPEIVRLLGGDEAARIAAAQHMPSYVVGRIAAVLRRARDSAALDPFVFLQMERQRAALLDHIGACERILGTPIPFIYSVAIRRFVVIYLCASQFALAGPAVLTSAAYAIMLAYPILTLEQIGAELQNPFVTRSLSHIDLARLCQTLENNVLALEPQRHEP
ncbi:MAG: hypothetical protein JNK82_05980 [Myxococcaceae bacterium]|nr:hypothetical protein [Myxococcaceae bacterium]